MKVLRNIFKTENIQWKTEEQEKGFRMLIKMKNVFGDYSVES